MLRTIALLCFIAGALLLLRGLVALFWPRLVARVDQAEKHYADRLKDMFQPMAMARRIALAQYIGPVVLALATLLLTRNAVFAIAIPVAVFLVPGFVFQRLRAQRLEKINLQLPDALRVMSDSAKAGLNLPGMIRMVASQGPKPVAEEFGLVVHAMDLGDSVPEALARVGARLSLPNFDLMATAIAVNRDRGGDIGHLFRRLAESIASLSEVEQRIDTETASVRMSAKIMVATIPVFGVLLFAMDPVSMSMLFTTWLGAMVLVAVAVLATTGYKMIQRLANPEI
ncbi:MAG: type II secretion system F family protein [Vicinamibacterales bacterium]